MHERGGVPQLDKYREFQPNTHKADFDIFDCSFQVVCYGCHDWILVEDTRYKALVQVPGANAQ